MLAPTSVVDLSHVVPLLRRPLPEHIEVKPVQQLLTLRKIHFQRKQRVVALEKAEHEALWCVSGTRLGLRPDDAVFVGAEQFPRPFRFGFAVVVEECHDGSRRRPDACVSRCGKTAVRLMAKTVAPCSLATSLVSSVDPSSTTMTWSSTSFCAARARRQRSTPAAPLSEQMTTLRSADIGCPLRLFS